MLRDMKNKNLSIDNKTIVVNLETIQDLKDAIQIMDSQHISKCQVQLYLKDGKKGLEIILYDNIDFLKELSEKGYDIDFCYFWYSINEEHSQVFPLSKLIETERILNLIVQEIKSSELSPLEKFIALYEIVYFFKPYKEEENTDLATSRGLYEYLNNSYMVCSGYANFLDNLCHRVGIPSEIITVYYQYGTHSRNYIHLNDPIHNISGYYVTDAMAKQNPITFMGLPIENFFKMIMTTNDQVNEKDYIYGSDFILMFTQERFLEEFCRLSTDFRNTSFMREFFKNIDPEQYEKYKNVDLTKKENLQNFYYYINSRINNPIPIDTLIKALLNVKKFIFKNMPEDFFYHLREFYKQIIGSQNDEELLQRILNYKAKK